MLTAQSTVQAASSNDLSGIVNGLISGNANSGLVYDLIEGFTNNVLVPRVEGVQWRQTINLKLRAVHNALYKDWWSIDLVARNGVLELHGATNIPGNLMFDDTYIIGFNDKTHNGRTRHIFKTDNSRGAGKSLEEQIQRFNNAKIKLGEPIFIHGINWSDTLTFKCKNSAIYGGPYPYYNTDNDYSRGYTTVSRWDNGFVPTEKGLKEILFFHTMYPWGYYDLQIMSIIDIF